VALFKHGVVNVNADLLLERRRKLMDVFKKYGVAPLVEGAVRA
jgi:hypothetical protein